MVERSLQQHRDHVKATDMKTPYSCARGTALVGPIVAATFLCQDSPRFVVDVLGDGLEAISGGEREFELGEAKTRVLNVSILFLLLQSSLCLFYP